MKVRIRKQVHSCFAGFASSDAMLYHDVELPFPPFIGLTVTDDNWYATIVTVGYDTESGLVCTTEPDKTLYYEELESKVLSPKNVTERLRPIVAAYLDIGWKTDDRRFNEAAEPVAEGAGNG